MIDYAREKLIFKIFMGIENEISLLLDILHRLNDAIQVIIQKISFLKIKINLSTDD